MWTKWTLPHFSDETLKSFPLPKLRCVPHPLPDLPVHLWRSCLLPGGRLGPVHQRGRRYLLEKNQPAVWRWARHVYSLSSVLVMLVSSTGFIWFRLTKVSSRQVLVMAPRWSWLCWTSITSLFWPGGFSTCLTPSPGTWPGHLATTHGTQVTNAPENVPVVPPDVFRVFLSFYILLFVLSFPENCVEFQRGNTSVNQTLDRNATSPVIEFWEWVLESVWCPLGDTSLFWRRQWCIASVFLFLVPAGDERWGFPQALTTWARWTGTWPCACSSPGSSATSASGKGPNPRERWVCRWKYQGTLTKRPH